MLITVPIHEGGARVRGQLAYDNPDIGISILYHRKMNAGSISCPEGNLSGVYHFYTMAVTAATMV